MKRSSKWVGFDVGSGRDFAKEVERTGNHRELMKFLEGRRSSQRKRGIPIAEVKRRLGLE